VLETMDVPSYTYARVAPEGDEIWVAGPRAELAVGDTVTLEGGMGMTDVESSELGRTFEAILFVNRYGTPGAADPGSADGGSGGLPSGHPQVGGGAGSAMDAAGAVRTGEVVEVIPAASYSYIRVRTDGGERWLAGPEVPLEPGQRIRWAEGMAMEDFESSALERTFDVLWFVDAVEVVE